MHIDISGGPGDGSVICSDYDNDHWVFTTIEVPYWLAQGYDGEHPVSGNREFGYNVNFDGSYTFYTRGEDRITGFIDSIVAEGIIQLNGDPFENPDALWNSFKLGIYNFVQSNSGVSKFTI
ncbi:hypothetical protein [Reichenbachiella sp. MALMAid0571]|uniref:hypothetical protein n=1 Tax=Reichenbachiella sp. MALMAid0571 TaxID=3143939 RepID=UPI0032DED8C7